MKFSFLFSFLEDDFISLQQFFVFLNIKKYKKLEIEFILFSLISLQTRRINENINLIM
jgi:hypothetical protein